MPRFAYSHRVTYADCTIGNHIYYGRYLELLEAARGEFLRSLGTSFLEWQLQGFAFPVTECSLRYKVPAQYDDRLSTELVVTEAVGARVNFAYKIFNQAGALVLEAETFHACTGLNGKPRRLPQSLAGLLAKDRVALPGDQPGTP